MAKVLVCPFGSVNLLLTLIFRIEQRFPGKYDFQLVSFTEYGEAVYRQLPVVSRHIPAGWGSGGLDSADASQVIQYSAALARRCWGDGMEAELSGAAHHYANRLRDWFDEERFDHVILFNGQFNLFVSVLDKMATRYQIPRLVFEEGLFRPHYITVDGRGVNNANSIESLDQMANPSPFNYQEIELYRDLLAVLPMWDREVEDFKRRVPLGQLARAYWRNRWISKQRIYLRTQDGRDFLTAALFPHHRRGRRTRCVHSLFASRQYDHYILCPLQVETDTQVILNSPHVQSMRQFVDVVSAALTRLNQARRDKACVIFKAHPASPWLPDGEPNSDVYFVNESTVPEILDSGCRMLITLNSTAAIEAMARGIPVITLGNAFYNLPRIAVPVSHSDELTNLMADVIDHGITDALLQREFVSWLRNRYQVRVFV